MGGLSKWSSSQTFPIHTKYPPELKCAGSCVGKVAVSAEACTLFLFACERRMDECGCLKAEVLALWISLIKIKKPNNVACKSM